MSVPDETLKHPVSDKTVETYKGWSWPGFFFTPIWLFLKGFAGRAIMYIIIGFLSLGLGGIIYSIVVGVKGNEWVYDLMIEKGYKPAHKLQENEPGYLDK